MLLKPSSDEARVLLEFDLLERKLFLYGEREASSEKSLSSRGDSAAEYRTGDLLVDVVERVHGAFDPCLVDLN